MSKADIMLTDSPIRRAMRNAVWLLAGKGTGGVFSLIYTALAARSLGVDDFGIFALILAYGQTIYNLARFQSWQTVVRYGAIHLAAGEPARLRRVMNFATALDLGAGLVGAVLGVAGAWLIGPHLGWSDRQQHLAMLFSLSLLFALRGTPTGILRLFDRFDIAAYSETVLPAMRLSGALIAWFTGASITAYLVAWSVAELVTTAVIWWAALRELRLRGQKAAGGARLKGVRAENPDLWHFAWTTNVYSSLALIWRQLPVLVVGWAGSPAAAGGYRIAANLVNALSKPAAALARAMYPELARLAVSERHTVARIVRQVTLATGLVGLAGVAVMTVLGRPAIRLIGGEEYLFAFPFLVLLTIAAAIELCGVAVEPAMTALGHPGRVLVVRAITGLFFIALLTGLSLALGPVGAAWAAVIGAVFLLAMLFAQYRRVLH